MNLWQKCAAALAVGIVAVLVGSGPAYAADPIPGPIDEILDVPSRVARSATGSPIGDTVMMMLRGQRWVAGGGSVVPAVPVAPPAVPKPITAPAAFARSGTALTAFLGAWALTAQGELVFTAMATGESYEDVFCSRPDWYQGVTSFVSLSLSPDCTGTVTTPNTDAGGPPTMTWAGGSLTLLGTVDPAGFSYRVGCYSGSVTKPAGTNWYYQTTSGAWLGQSGPSVGGFNYNNGCVPAGLTGGVAASLFSGASMGNGMLALRSSTTGETVSEMTTPVANPTRTAKCRIDWEDGSTTTGTGASYTDNDGLPLSASGLGCEQAYVSKPGAGPDLMPDEITVESDKGGSITEIATQDVPDFAPDERKAFETGNGHGLVLSKVIGTVATSCMTWEADCANWWEQTDEGTTPGVYRCTYAGEAIALIECGAYRHTFDTRTGTPTVTDPTTGESVDWSAQPNTGNSLNPGVGPGTGASPADSCFATGWASVANPVDWVLVPVKCALVWAFVPRTSAVEETVTALGESAGEVAAVDPLLALLGELPSGGGCAGIPVSLEFFGQTASGTLLYACDGYGATAAAVVNGLLTLAVCTGAIIAVARYAAAVFGFVGPGGQMETTQRSVEHEMNYRASRARND